MNKIVSGLVYPEQVKKMVISSGDVHDIDELAVWMNIPSAQASVMIEAWLEEGRVLDLRYQDKRYFPSYLFDPILNFEPRPVIKKIVHVLSEKMGPWQVAFWFICHSRFLQNLSPRQVILDDEELVLKAAVFEIALGDQHG